MRNDELTTDVLLEANMTAVARREIYTRVVHRLRKYRNAEPNTLFKNQYLQELIEELNVKYRFGSKQVMNNTISVQHIKGNWIVKLNTLELTYNVSLSNEFVMCIDIKNLTVAIRNFDIIEYGNQWLLSTLMEEADIINLYVAIKESTTKLGAPNGEKEGK